MVCFCNQCGIFLTNRCEAKQLTKSYHSKYKMTKLYTTQNCRQKILVMEDYKNKTFLWLKYNS